MKYRVVNYSRRCSYPNHNSDCTNSTVEKNTKDLEALIGKTCSEPVFLIGQSYGGSIVALYASRHPELVRGLVLIEPYLPAMVVPNSNVQRISLLIRHPSVAQSGLKSEKNIKTTQELVKNNKLEEALDSYYPGTWEGRDVKVPLSKDVRATMLNNMENFMELTSKPPTFNKEDANRLKIPTLVVSGEYTVTFMKGIASSLQKTILNNESIIVANAAHYPHIENPEKCNEAIIKFLSKHSQ
jgi:esterase